MVSQTHLVVMLVHVVIVPMEEGIAYQSVMLTYLVCHDCTPVLIIFAYVLAVARDLLGGVTLFSFGTCTHITAKDCGLFVDLGIIENRTAMPKIRGNT